MLTVTIRDNVITKPLLVENREDAIAFKFSFPVTKRIKGESPEYDAAILCQDQIWKGQFVQAAQSSIVHTEISIQNVVIFILFQ